MGRGETRCRSTAGCRNDCMLAKIGKRVTVCWSRNISTINRNASYKSSMIGKGCCTGVAATIVTTAIDAKANYNRVAWVLTSETVNVDGSGYVIAGRGWIMFFQKQLPAIVRCPVVATQVFHVAKCK